MMKISDELIQGFALGDSMLKAVGEQVARDAALAEDKAMLKRKSGLEMLVGNCMAIRTGTQKLGDLFIDDASGTFLIWNGTDWDAVGPFTDLQVEIDRSGYKQVRPIIAVGQSITCPYCATLNSSDVRECGAGCWNGCGAPLGEQ